MNLTLVTAPKGEPITLTEIQGQTRLVDLSAESETVELMISAVRERAEAITKRALVTQSWLLTLDAFPSGRSAIQLPKPPLQTVDSIAYCDANGVWQILDPLAYRVVISSEPGYVVPIYGLNWPTVLNDVGVVTIKFTCGYGPITPDTSLNVPKGILQWIAMNVANIFENRETEGIAYRETKFDLSTLADGLIENYRIFRV